MERYGLHEVASIEDLVERRGSQFGLIVASSPLPHDQAYCIIDIEDVDNGYQMNER